MSIFQSNCGAGSVGNSQSSSLLSLVGDTMSTANRVPFVWSSDYEVAIVYITSMWLEMDNTEQSPVAWNLIAKNGFLSYCVRFKNRLATFAKSLQHNPDVGFPVRRAVTSWYQAIDQLSRNNWDLSGPFSLRSFALQFRTSFKHLLINGADIYENDALTDKEARIVDDFTKEIASMMIEIMREISRQVRDVPVKNDDGNII